MSRARERRGFTLLELLVTIAVIAVLASVVGPMVFGNVGDARTQAARAQLQIFELALDSYRLDNDYYPAESQGLAALVERPSGSPAPRQWRGPYLRRGLPLDPWGKPYLYRLDRGASGERAVVSTLGRDGRPGGTGEDSDISTGGTDGQS